MYSYSFRLKLGKHEILGISDQITRDQRNEMKTKRQKWHSVISSWKWKKKKTLAMDMHRIKLSKKQSVSLYTVNL